MALKGRLREVHSGEAIGMVVSITPDRHGMDEFDEYEIAFEDSRQLRFRSFQLTHLGLTDDKNHEKAANLRSQGELDIRRK